MISPFIRWEFYWQFAVFTKFCSHVKEKVYIKITFLEIGTQQYWPKVIGLINSPHAKWIILIQSNRWLIHYMLAICTSFWRMRTFSTGLPSLLLPLNNLSKADLNRWFCGAKLKPKIHLPGGKKPIKHKFSYSFKLSNCTTTKTNCWETTLLA